MGAKRYNEMSFGELVLAGAAEAVEISEGRAKPARSRRIVTARNTAVTPPPSFRPADVRAIRKRLGCSQTVFAQALSVSAPTVRSWEQGNREPDGAARRLLQIASEHPDIMLDAIEAFGDEP
jgi:putative transcriptional regulator